MIVNTEGMDFATAPNLSSFNKYTMMANAAIEERIAARAPAINPISIYKEGTDSQRIHIYEKFIQSDYIDDKY